MLSVLINWKGCRMTLSNAFFKHSLEQGDAEIFNLINHELNRQRNHIELIASENIVSKAVLQAVGSVLTNKYAEGYPSRRYYDGCGWVDAVETLAVERAKKLFHAEFANVQPHSGSQANAAVYLALLQPGDAILGLSLDSGGHLTHGSKVSSSGKYYQSFFYGVNPETGLIDLDEVEKTALRCKPKLIIAGGSAYAREIDFAGFRRIADKTGAYLMVDMAHFAGLVAGGVYQNPLPFADVVTSTTHKTLRGPRGGLILTNSEPLAKKINSAVFPGLQGGPLMHVIAGKAVAFKEALDPSFACYARQIILNARAFASVFKSAGYQLVSNGTDTHLILLDLRKQGITGKEACGALSNAHIICNKNCVPNDPQKPAVTSGLRLGTPAGTTRGFKEGEFRQTAGFIIHVLNALANHDPHLESVISETRRQAEALCEAFPVYENIEQERL